MDYATIDNGYGESVSNLERLGNGVGVLYQEERFQEAIAASDSLIDAQREHQALFFGCVIPCRESVTNNDCLAETILKELVSLEPTVVGCV